MSSYLNLIYVGYHHESKLNLMLIKEYVIKWLIALLNRTNKWGNIEVNDTSQEEAYYIYFAIVTIH